MGRYVAGEAPAADAMVAAAVKGIGEDIAALGVPRLAGVVLGGGYGRGEGGVAVRADGTDGLYNDLDFFAVTEAGASGAAIAAVRAALAPVAARWTERLGVDVDFTVRTPWRLRHDQARVMIQELLHGYVDVAGAPGEALFAGVARRGPAAFPWTEAARLLMNRGMGLLLAAEASDAGFVARNLNKCVLGAGDAVLLARGEYRWRAEERAEILGDALYTAAVAWKFRPRAEAVCDWERARAAWLAAADAVRAAGRRAGAGRRTVRAAARWLVRRRTVGPWRTFGMDATVRVFRQVADAVRRRAPVAPALRRDWEIFN